MFTALNKLRSRQRVATLIIRISLRRILKGSTKSCIDYFKAKLNLYGADGLLVQLL